MRADLVAAQASDAFFVIDITGFFFDRYTMYRTSRAAELASHAYILVDPRFEAHQAQEEFQDRPRYHL